jgi:hypothetical protein
MIGFSVGREASLRMRDINMGSVMAHKDPEFVGQCNKGMPKLKMDL